jgi:hypothetical protein
MQALYTKAVLETVARPGYDAIIPLSVRRSAMRISVFTLLFTVFILAPSTSAQTHPIPPGIRQADQTEAQTEKNIPPPASPHVTVDYAKLKRDADELAALAQSVPADVAQSSKGVLPKDLSEKLKRIEKLAKQLRSRLSP